MITLNKITNSGHSIFAPCGIVKPIIGLPSCESDPAPPEVTTPLSYPESSDLQITGGDDEWYDLFQLESGDSYTEWYFAISSVESTDLIVLTDFDVAYNLPTNATITDVHIEINARSDIVGTPASIDRLSLWADGATGGSVQDSQELTALDATYTFAGDLDYWGLTNTQMYAFVGAGAIEGGGTVSAGYMRFGASVADSSAITFPSYVTVNWVKCQITFAPAVNTPAAPTGLLVYPRSPGTWADVFWTDNSNNETGFSIRRMDSPYTSWVEIDTVAADVTSYSDTSLPGVDAYYYRVYATNAAADSSAPGPLGANYGYAFPGIWTPVLDADANSFNVVQWIRDSDGNSFTSPPTNFDVYDSDGNGFILI